MARAKSIPPVNERLRQRLDVRGPDDCWEWVGYRQGKGYGVIMDEGTSKLAHRVAYKLAHGSVPDGACVCHSCDNPACCNPAHLWTGSIADNNYDRDQKGRGRTVRGEAHPLAKLSEGDADEIRRLYAEGDIAQRELADRSGVSQRRVWAILHDAKAWATISPPETS